MKLLTAKGVDAFLTRREVQKLVTSLPVSDGSYRASITNRFNVPDSEGMKRIAEKYEEDFPMSAMAKYFKGRAFLMTNDQSSADIYFTQCLSLLLTDSTLTANEKEVYKNRCEGFIK